MVYTLTAESVAPEGCHWTPRNHDPSTTSTTTRLYRVSHHFRIHWPLRARTTYNIPEKTFRTRTSFHIVLGPHLQLDGQKHPKPVPSGRPDTSYIPT